MNDIFNPARPAGAYDDLLAEVLPLARERRDWQPTDGPLPSLFVSHGAPPTLDDPEWLRGLFDWGQTLPRPRGIVVVSAHWENAPLAISATAAGTPLYYDFGGFHPRYYTLQYSTPDATELGNRVDGALADTTPKHQHVDRGLDHGAFIPLMAMFPAADVPVIQVSMPSLDPESLLQLGQRLRGLREEGYLIVGSGFMTHSFAVMRRPELVTHNREFDAWASEAVGRLPAQGARRPDRAPDRRPLRAAAARDRRRQRARHRRHHSHRAHHDGQLHPLDPVRLKTPPERDS